MKAVSKIISVIMCILTVCFTAVCAHAEESNNVFSSVKEGCYKIKNESTGLYLTVDGNLDNNQQNVIAQAYTGKSGQVFMIYKAPDGYYLRAESSVKSGRVLNADADDIVSGNNVNIFNFFEENTMMWQFKSCEGGYTVHNSYNTSCMLTVNKSRNVLVTDDENDKNTLWTLEKADGTTYISVYETLCTCNSRNAILYATVFNPDNKKISEYGFTLYDSNDNLLKKYSKKSDKTSASLNIKADINKLTGIELTPDTTYKYSFYAQIGGKKYTTSKKSFKTGIEYRNVLAHGIDVSSWQGSVDWDKVAKDGIDFAILRAGFSGEADNRFEEYYLKARKAGLDLGCYFYTYAVTVDEAIKDANELLALIKGKKFEYPVYIDIEDKVHHSLTVEERTRVCTAFMKTMSDAGYLAGTYSSLYWYKSLLLRDEIEKNGEIWMAFWTESYNTTDTYYGLWQYTSKGKISGISGNVDLDVAFVDYPRIIKQNGLNGYKKLTVGDADGDGEVSMQDVTTLQKIIAKLIPQPEKGDDAFFTSDVNNDGAISMEDATKLQLFIAKLIESFN